MPNTANYDFEYETPSSIPGITLTGGPGGGSPILAQQVDTALAGEVTTLEASITGLTSQLSALETRIDDLEAAQPLSDEVSVTPDTEIMSGFYNSSYWRGTETVSFPVGYFAATPNVTAIAQTTVPGTLIEVGVSNITTSGFDVYVARANTTTTVVHWIAAHDS